jgi:3'(2'), 5'-bisphosphate nucleotidase
MPLSRRCYSDSPLTTGTSVHALESLVLPLIELCREAGEVICRHYHAPGEVAVQAKQDDSPLTSADMESHHLLQAGLSPLAGGLPVLSEESHPAHKARRREWPRYWLVDPLDGTKEFVAGTGEFTINIALIDGHRPVLGVLYLPLARAAYVGLPGLFARRYVPAPDGSWVSRDITARKLSEGAPLVVLASRRHRGQALRECLDWLQAHWGPIERCNSGSALKFCQLAEGEGDFYPRFSPCCEWDTGAGQALLEAAGGMLLGLDGEPLRYNCRDTLLSPHFLAIADAGHPLWRQYLAERGEVAGPA